LIPKIYLADLILSPGHFKHFLVSAEAREQIVRGLHILKTYGILYYLQAEYPEHLEKSIIINTIGGSHFAIDGNRHILTLYIFDSTLKIENLYRIYPHCLRLWADGYEQEQTTMNEVWIPLDVDTDALIADVKIVTDYSKNPPTKTKSIPGNIRFDSELFSHVDRGRKISEVGNFLKNKI